LAKTPAALWPECTRQTFAYEEMAGQIMAQWLPSEVRRPIPCHAVLAFTSPCDHDGTTELLLGLAPCLADRSPGGVLAMDANASHPELTTRVSVEPHRHETAAPAYPTNIRQLSVLPAQVHRHLQDFTTATIDALRDTWPLTLIDLPSLAHHHVASFASRCDGVYLVVRLGSTPRYAVVDAARLLRKSGARLLGCLVLQ
jgi:hypothetical protein